MFDKLIESESQASTRKNRRRYFITSSVVVGLLFSAAVVASIFATDYHLGNHTFELTQMLAPVELAAVEPDTPKPRALQADNQTPSNLVSRQVNMTNLQENPIVPKGMSVTQNNQLARPSDGRFLISKFDSDGGAKGGDGRDRGYSLEGPSGFTLSPPVTKKEVEPDTELPPTVKKDTLNKSIVVSKGPLNSVAKFLPKPIYPQTARMLKVQGKVSVQVTIDEKGNVISAKSIDGHPLLKTVAESAARAAKFTPTILGDVPIKVTGVITYNFVL